jgi:hypothetical protein
VGGAAGTRGGGEGRDVNEQNWLACANPVGMVGFLGVWGSDRKWRLFACACCRLAWHDLTDPRSQGAVEAAEAFADGQTPREAMEAAWQAATAAAAEQPAVSLGAAVAAAAGFVARPGVGAGAALHAIDKVAWAPSTAPRGKAGRAGRAHREQVGRRAATLLRCVVGNPFRPVTPDPAWRVPQVLALGQAAYDGRELPAGTLDAARLAVLADALEEAGCTDQAVLEHLRGPGPHVRGCWAVDLVLGKQ